MVDQFIYIYIVDQWFTTWSIDQWRNKGPPMNCLIHVLTGVFFAPIYTWIFHLRNPRRQEVKNLDLRVFEFSDLGILQKSAMYFVAWLFWRVTGRWVGPFGEVFVKEFFCTMVNHHSITVWENICCFGWVFQRWTRRSGGLDGLKREFWKKEESEESGSGSTRKMWFGLVV